MMMMMITRLALLVASSAVALASVGGATSVPECPATTDASGDDFVCSLFMAPSSVEDHAGYGVYTAVHLKEGDRIGDADGFVPVVDRFKTLPYRGQQQFLSWLGYVWPAHPDYFYSAETASFPVIPESMYGVDPGLNGATGLKFYRADTGERVSAFAPGVASLANAAPPSDDEANVKMIQDGTRVSFVATRRIAAGSELLIHYGRKWHHRYRSKQDSETEFDTLQDFQQLDIFNTLPTEQDKRRALAKQRQPRLDVDDDDEFHDDGDSDGNTEADTEQDLEVTFRAMCDKDGRVSKQNIMKWNKIQELLQEESLDEKELDELWTKTTRLDLEGFLRFNAELNDFLLEDDDDDDDTSEQLEWLKQNGMCIDKIRSGQSTKVAGEDGAFAKTFIPKGHRIAPAPLLALKRQDLVIYEADETQNALRNVLNFDKIVGQEELLNYCYGHPESDLLLLPYSPVVNFIHHDANEPNAEIQWPTNHSNDWLDLHPLDVSEMSGKLMAEFVALRDIQPGEEIVIDYGKAWENAWNAHKSTNGDDEFRHEIGVPDGFFPDGWKNQSLVYELAPLEAPLKPGEVIQMKWAHNGNPVCKVCYRAGLPAGFSQHFRDFADERGIIKLYEKLLYNDILESDEWTVVDTLGEQWFAQRYMSRAWSFNMH